MIGGRLDWVILWVFSRLGDSMISIIIFLLTGHKPKLECTSDQIPMQDLKLDFFT